MPLLGTLVTTLFGGLFSWFTAFFTAKVALGVSTLAVITVIAAAYAVAMEALIAGFVVAFPEIPAPALSILWVAIPDQATAAIGAMLASDTLAAVYGFNMGRVRVFSRAVA